MSCFLASYFKPGWIVPLVKITYNKAGFFGLGEINLQLSDEIFVLFCWFTKSFLIDYQILTKPIKTTIWFQPPIRIECFTKLKNHLGYLERYLSYVVQLFMILAHYPVNLKPFLRYLPSIVHRQYFVIIFLEKRCALYSIKFSKSGGYWFQIFMIHSFS
jgi:hypothetical protein